MYHCDRSEGEQYSCEVHKSAILAHLLEASLSFTVYIVLQIEKLKISLNLFHPPIVKLNSLLVDLLVRNKNISVKILSISIIEGATEL